MSRAKTSSCDLMQGDFNRIGKVWHWHADGTGGLILGPKGNTITYEVRCGRKNADGTCATFRITRSGPGARGLKKSADVGSPFGLVNQLSRDAARLWCGKLTPTRGFEGRRPKRRR